MAELPYEEEKKQVRMPVYENGAPVGTYYGEQGNQQTDMYQEIMRRAAENADPARQAEQDARIQRSRNFWTGANLFANVVANAINVNGTARNAPNMTWNDAATQKMYDTWQTADKELRADRKAAAQRLDALQMEDAKLRAAGAEKRAAEQQEANKMNFNIALEEARHERALQEKEADRGYAEQLADRKRQQDLEDYEKKLKMQARYRPRTTGRSGLKDSGGNSVSLGSVDIPAKDKKEAEKIRKDIANKIVERHNAGVEARNAEKKKNNRFIDEKELEKPLAKPKNDKESEGIIYQLGGMYDDDTDFRNDINSTYGIEDIYDDEPAVGADGYGAVQTMPWSEDFTRGLEERGVPTVTQTPDWKRQVPTRQNVQNQDGGYFLGSRRQPFLNTIPLGNNAAFRTDGNKIASYKVEGNNRPLNDVNGKPVSMENGRFIGTERPAHKLTEAEKKAIEQNGEKPVFHDYLN